MPPHTMRSRREPKASLIYLHKPTLVSSAVPADCSVCGRGLGDGFTVTAKALPGAGIGLFCEIHCP